MAVRARLACHESIFGGHHGNNTSDAEALADDEKRHALLRALLDLPPLKQEAATLVYYGPLALPRDVPWIVDQMMAADLAAARTRWAEILVRLRFHYGTLDILEATVAAWDSVRKEANELRRVLRSFWHDGYVDISSPLAADLRKMELEQEARNREYEKLCSQGGRPCREIPPVAEHIADCLERFETGDADAGWELHDWMTIDPEGKAGGHEYEPDLIRLPGWKHADEQTFNVILAIEVNSARKNTVLIF